MIYLELFYVFFYIGLLTFGGGYAMIPMIQEEIVARGWLSAESLTDFIAISESTPGPFAINIATFVGSQSAGIFGAVCSTLGVVMPSFIIILIVSFVLRKIIKNKHVQGALKGIRPVVIALILYTAVSLLLKASFFNSKSISVSNFAFSQESSVLFVLLLGFYLLYKKEHKKSLNAILLLGIAALLGLIIF